MWGWQFCNYASPKDRVAFPRDSGPSGKCDWVWSSMNRKDCRVKSYTFEIYGTQGLTSGGGGGGGGGSLPEHAAA